MNRKTARQSRSSRRREVSSGLNRWLVGSGGLGLYSYRQDQTFVTTHGVLRF